MDKKALIAAGGIVPGGIVKKHCKWEKTDGDSVEFDIGVIRASFGQVEKILTTSGDGSATVRLIAHCVRLGDDFKERLTVEEVERLEPSLARVFAQAIKEVQEPEKKTSAPRPKSGTSSSSPESGGEQ